jgi:uncharacterized OsmC-like protein
MEHLTVTHAGDMILEARLGDHEVRADAPLSMMGDNRAPTPGQYFLFSLGSCIGAYVAYFCERVGIDTTGLSVVIHYNKMGDRIKDLKATIQLPCVDPSDHAESIIEAGKEGIVCAAIENTSQVQVDLIELELTQ